MTRLLALVGMVAGAIAALLVWLSARDLRGQWTVPPMPLPDEMDDIQPADPVTAHHHPRCNEECFEGWHHLDAGDTTTSFIGQRVVVEGSLGPVRMWRPGPYTATEPIPGT